MSIVDHIPVYGQSWSPGVMPAGLAVTTSSSLADVLMFNTGVRQRPDGTNETALSGATLTSLVALIEATTTMSDGSSAPLGETPCAGLGYWLKPNIANKLLISSNGRGGYRASLLAKGTQPYTNLQTCLSKGKTLVEAGGDTYRVPCLVYLQGEGDVVAQTYAAWAAAVEQLRLDFQADYRTLTGNGSAVIPMFIYQGSSFWNNWIAGSNSILTLPAMPMIQLGLHESNSNIRVIAPGYVQAYASDQLHLPAHGYRQYGELIGRAIKEHCYDGASWECLRPASVVRSGQSIDITLTGNSGQIVFDSASTSDDVAKGFAVQVAGNSVKLADVRITGDHSLRLTMAYNPQGTTVVNYALPFSNPNLFVGLPSGPRGSVRDSTAPASVFGYANLYKWLVHFTKTAQGTS